ncbi:YihY/virulence factor BrkB family protein [Longispora albida]|uniref:YihY/virulence factor BrkB family protein n=1 Tax=Longispora albida TaxID=203523 RepID=UPI00037CE79A|nr:YihY/virulence factor BrkB family protein [Longispora albida]
MPESAGPLALSRREWLRVLWRTGREFSSDNLADWAAALTYYGVLSMFPGLILLVAALGYLDAGSTQPLVDNLTVIAPAEAQEILNSAIAGLREAKQTAGTVALISLAVALWSATGYVGAFMRAANVIFGVPEGRPMWKVLPLRLGITLAVGILFAASAVIVVLTGRLATVAGDLLDAGPAARTTWAIAKWPVLVLLMTTIITLLYWAAPNARQRGLRWVTPGGLLAVLLWGAASAGFAFYAARFGSYNKTYGALGGVIVFLVWLWISNLAILLGAKLDAVLHRARAIAAGQPGDAGPGLPPRDTSALAEQRQADVAADAPLPRTRPESGVIK